jgi:diguanylate cyclase (GGDEF)-like protein
VFLAKDSGNCSLGSERSAGFADTDSIGPIGAGSIVHYPMKRLIPAVAIVLGWASATWAAPPAPLTTLRAVHALSNAEASQKLPVAFEATVTYYPGYEHILFVQDDDVPVFVLASNDAKLVPGDRVLIKGTTLDSFHPIVIPDSLTLLRHGDLPKPAPATFDELIRAKYDCRLVTVHAVIRTADLKVNSSVPGIYMQMLTDGGYIDAEVDSKDAGDAGALRGLLDAEVEVTGVAGGKFDGKMQQIGVLLHVSSLANVKVLKRAGASPQSIPITPMNEILAGYNVQDRTQRVRVHGTITYYQPGSAIVLQDGAKSEWITTLSRDPFQIGDVADATGFPDTHNGSLVLTHSDIEDSHAQAPIAPQPATWRQLAFWSANQPDGHLYDLVSIEGQVVTEVRGATQDEYVLALDGRLFSAIYRHPQATGSLLPMMQVPPGSRVRITGICVNDDLNTFNTNMELPFYILLRSFDDITVIAGPSLVNTRNLILLVGLLLVVVCVVGAMSWSIERKMSRQTAAMAARTKAEAALERQRSRILEDINGSLPLTEILEEITAMLSSMLNGAPCWCEAADGARLGNCPPEPHNLRIVCQKIAARSGPPLGTLFAGLDPETSPAASETVALGNGVRLAALAIETRRLYTDLRRRSEFDLLTEIHNRFSLDKYLDALTEEARENAGIFGLIYIDLDKFKQINDRYGHHIGDLYLQEVALRMKRQMRGGDMLARLGGDEFAALVTMVRGRADAEEIALRLERCFDAPFVVEGYLLRGEASFGIALYPEDGATKDSLLSAADAVMYAAKHRKRQIEKSLAPSPHLELAVEERG